MFLQFISQVPMAEHGLTVGRSTSPQLKKMFKVKKTPALFIITDGGDSVVPYEVDEFNAGALMPL